MNTREQSSSKQVRIIFPDDSIKEFKRGVTAFEIAHSISPSLAKNSMVVYIDDKLSDIYTPITNDVRLRLITINDKGESRQKLLDIIRHDAAHIMAQAVKSLYPNTQVTIGPAIENGFYYDFVRDIPFIPEDLVKIEQKMYEIIKQDFKFEREVWGRNQAIEYFKSIGENYKVKIIEEIPENEELTIYKQGDFVDLCRGPHAPSTGKIKYFKLLKISGAYWKGDSKNEMLQRIYGTAWESKTSLENYLKQLEEAEKRDHRKLGVEIQLFHLQEEAVGSVFWHEKGYCLFRIIEEYIRKKLTVHDYREIKTPLLIDRKLWEKSGHWEKFRDNMFIAEEEHKVLALKPMNCPAHVQVFNQGIKSYRDLPLRFSEFGCCHRSEPSGALHGLMRVRAFTQDDGHIFCTEEHILEETKNFINLLITIYKDFGFNDVTIKFSTRPDLRAGSDEIWDKAEDSLKDAIDQIGISYSINKGEGAFYGPKLEFVLRDAIGRDWQCGTLQLDFVLPERLNATYIDKNGTKKHPVMLHRAILGSFERFIGILIEEYEGKFPLWLAPTQMVVTSITNAVDQYAKTIYQKLKDSNLRAILDIGNEKISYKVRKHSIAKVKYIIVVGEKEAENNSITFRTLGSTEQKTMPLQNAINLFLKESQMPQ